MAIDLIARGMAGSVGSGFYVKPSTGIPASDMSAEVQASLGLADSSLQTPSTETYTLASSDWGEMSGREPYKYSAEIIPTHIIGQTTRLRLVNDNAVAFAKYGIVIGDYVAQGIKMHAISMPQESITLKIEYYDI